MDGVRWALRNPRADTLYFYQNIRKQGAQISLISAGSRAGAARGKDLRAFEAAPTTAGIEVLGEGKARQRGTSGLGGLPPARPGYGRGTALVGPTAALVTSEGTDHDPHTTVQHVSLHPTRVEHRQTTPPPHTHTHTHTH